MGSSEWGGTQFKELPTLEAERMQSGKAYLEFLRVPEMSVGIYVLPSGGTDLQKPHREPEIYYVIRGRGRMRAGNEDRPVGPGSMVFVPPGVEHRFHDIEEELTVLVLFAPAESQ